MTPRSLSSVIKASAEPTVLGLRLFFPMCITFHFSFCISSPSTCDWTTWNNLVSSANFDMSLGSHFSRSLVNFPPNSDTSEKIYYCCWLLNMNQSIPPLHSLLGTGSGPGCRTRTWT
uniref:Uncharacterized protein n=1 Tax=Crocodylus porosus TaxID=8502 RepID=A0A7M4FI73_CROPO